MLHILPINSNLQHHKWDILLVLLCIYTYFSYIVLQMFSLVVYIILQILNIINNFYLNPLYLFTIIVFTNFWYFHFVFLPLCTWNLWFNDGRLWSIWENGFLCSSFKSSCLFNNTISWRDSAISKKCEQLVRISLDHTNLGSLYSWFLPGSILDLYNFVSHLRCGNLTYIFIDPHTNSWCFFGNDQ